MKLELKVDVRFSPQAAFYALTAAALLLGTSRLASEDLTLSTYYPSPLGVYKQLVTTGNGSLNTILARDAGKVGIGTASPGAYKLEVVGAVHVTGATTIDSSLSTLGNAYFGATAARSGWVLTNGSAYVAGSLGIGTSNPSQALHVVNNIRTDGYITNLCQTVFYSAGGFTSCPNANMTAVAVANSGSQDSTPYAPLTCGANVSNTTCRSGYPVGAGSGCKCSAFPPTGNMYCCRFY